MKMNNYYIFYSLLICLFVSVSSCSVPSPQERFQDKYISTYYGYKVEEDTNYLQAMDSGWMSHELFELICDLDLHEKTYGQTVNKAQNILDSTETYLTPLCFPFSLPQNCTNDQLIRFLRDDCGERWGLNRREHDSHWNALPWDTLLTKYEKISFSRNDVTYSDFVYTTFRDTLIDMEMIVGVSLHEAMESKFGRCASYKEMLGKPEYNYAGETTIHNYYDFLWVDENYIINLHESQYINKSKPDYSGDRCTLSYTNRNTLHAYRNAVKQSKLQYAEEQRIKREQEKIKETQRQQEQLERHRQDSIRRAAGAILNL